jgi:hypothetical protein
VSAGTNERQVAADDKIHVAGIDLDRPVPAGKPGCDVVSVQSAAPEGRRQVENHSVRGISLDDGIRVMVDWALASS